MNTGEKIFLAAASFACGVVTGLLMAPQSGQRSRQQLTDKMRAQSRWMEQRLRTVGEQVEHLEQQVQQFGHEVADKVRDTTKEQVDKVIPTLPEDPESWEVEGKEVAEDLRHMPRR